MALINILFVRTRRCMYYSYAILISTNWKFHVTQITLLLFMAKFWNVKNRMGFKHKTFILRKRSKIFCNTKCGVINNMLYVLSHKHTCRHLRWSFFAAVAHNFQPSLLDVSMIPICVSSYFVTV